MFIINERYISPIFIEQCNVATCIWRVRCGIGLDGGGVTGIGNQLEASGDPLLRQIIPRNVQAPG